MSYDLEKVLVIGISSRALFDLEVANEIFNNDPENYAAHQIEHLEDTPPKGPGFNLVRNLLSLNQEGATRRVEVIILSRNNPETSLRITRAIKSHGLDITRSAWTGGDLVRYLGAYNVDLFLSAHKEDVQSAINAGFTAARILTGSQGATFHKSDENKIKIAFDGDAVLFTKGDEIYPRGLDGFAKHEKEHALTPLPEGPFTPLLRAISKIQKSVPADQSPIRTALVTARCGDALERVIRTFHAWGVRIDEAHFLGGVNKKPILEAFGADIFFDDQEAQCLEASEVVPAAVVPLKPDCSTPTNPA